MKTTFRVRQPYADIFLKCADEFECVSPARPERFIRKMRENRGAIASLTGMGLDDEGLERKNPVIVALGDSVTAGHFENLLPTTADRMRSIEKRVESGVASFSDMEITDARRCYPEQFREMLIERFELTSVSVINAGIAGDHLISMARRAQRDVIRYQPDLVLINGVLNWSKELGTAEDYQAILTALVRRIRRETEADIILLTPNGDVANRTAWAALMGVPAVEPTTPERVAAVRAVAAQEQVCLADVYAVWEAVRDAGCPWRELLANEVNHPGVEGHTVYAKVLMKLME